MHEEFEENAKLYGFPPFALRLEYLKFAAGLHKALTFDEAPFYTSTKILVPYVRLPGTAR